MRRRPGRPMPRHGDMHLRATRRGGSYTSPRAIGSGGTHASRAIKATVRRADHVTVYPQTPDGKLRMEPPPPPWRRSGWLVARGQRARHSCDEQAEDLDEDHPAERRSILRVAEHTGLVGLAAGRDDAVSGSTELRSRRSLASTRSSHAASPRPFRVCEPAAVRIRLCRMRGLRTGRLRQPGRRARPAPSSPVERRRSDQWQRRRCGQLADRPGPSCPDAPGRPSSGPSAPSRSSLPPLLGRSAASRADYQGLTTLAYWAVGLRHRRLHCSGGEGYSTLHECCSDLDIGQAHAAGTRVLLRLLGRPFRFSTRSQHTLRLRVLGSPETSRHLLSAGGFDGIDLTSRATAQLTETDSFASASFSTTLRSLGPTWSIMLDTYPTSAPGPVGLLDVRRLMRYVDELLRSWPTTCRTRMWLRRRHR